MGIEFRETMAGSFHLHDGVSEERPLHFTLRAFSRRLSSFLRIPLVEVEGEFHAEGFADHVPTRGTLALDLLRDKTLTYDLRFPGNDGKPYRFKGRKTVVLRRLLATMTELPAVLLNDQGQEIGSALVRFDAQQDLPSFLRSFRWI
ncbi:MAG: hypothetical protein RMJ98_17045 [Myxococcales bacterium]|nr:hypothetical protein [Myxococcales bacterium]